MPRGRVYVHNVATPYVSNCPQRWLLTFSGMTWGYCILIGEKFAVDPNTTCIVDETAVACAWSYEDPLSVGQIFEIRSYLGPGCTGSSSVVGRATISVVRNAGLGGWRVLGEHTATPLHPFFDSGWIATPLIRTFTNIFTSDDGGQRLAHSGQCTIVDCYP